MRSHQVNFFCLPEELPTLEAYFRGRGMVFIHEPLRSSETIISETLAPRNDENWFRKIMLAKYAFVDKISTRYIDKQQYFLVDEPNSCVIEYSVGGFNPLRKNVLHRSRLYATLFVENSEGDRIEKDADFSKWVKTTMRDFKKNFLKKSDEVSFIYITRLAEIWKKDSRAQFSGGAMELVAL